METLINPQNTSEIASKANSSLTDVFISMFQNPFKALAEGNFLAIIVFSIAFGLALKMISEELNIQEKLRLYLK